MADDPARPNLKSFSAYRDENGQAMGQDAPNDVARPAGLRAHLDGDPSGEAETARLASGHASQGADDQTAAETPPETLSRISDPSGATGKGAPGEAIERATAGLGKPA